MDKKTIDNIVWWIPFKKLRNSVREILNILVDIQENQMLLKDNEWQLNNKLENITALSNINHEINSKLDRIIIQNIEIEARQKLSLLENKIIKEVRNPRLIVSLTTYPERHNYVDVVIYSLLTQSILPDKIILWLSNEEYPNGLENVPDSILKLQKLGLEIDFCKNIRSYNKLIPTLKKYPDDIIVTADDDVYYPDKWLEELYNSHLEKPNYIHAHRCYKIVFDDFENINEYLMWINPNEVYNSKYCASFSIFPTGVGGVLYTKKLLYKDILNEELFTKLCPTGDDIWFWAMEVLNNTKINVVYGTSNMSILIDIGRYKIHNKLSYLNVLDKNNDKQIKAMFIHYPELKDRLLGFNSAMFWEKRYQNGGNSGAGSYNKLAEFKSQVLNDFIQNNKIEHLIEWGSGDGNQLEQFIIPKYTGIDISKTVVDKMRLKYAGDNSKQFLLVSEYNGIKADLAISLDVIYYLIEEDIFNTYMLNLFNSSNRFIIIYSSNKDEYHVTHVKHRKFTDWIDRNKSDWKLLMHIPNKYPENKNLLNDTSFADFYIFKNIGDK